MAINLKKNTLRERRSDAKMQKYIKGRANYSLAIIGKAFVNNGSGRFLNIRNSGDAILTKRKASCASR
jgi:hypothetical protein